MSDKNYKVLIYSETIKKTKDYLQRVQLKSVSAGALFKGQLEKENLTDLTIERFLELLLQTKSPQIFAESAVYGDGSDWNQTELSILGDIVIAMPVVVYDNALHIVPTVYDSPLSATLIYTPGALLRNDSGNTPADWKEVTQNDQIDPQGYYTLYERRLLPVFQYIDETVSEHGTKALVTIPGIGCGQFAGRFRGQMGCYLEAMLLEFLKRHSKEFSSIEVIYYDPYSECENSRYEIEHISLLVRPLKKGNQQRPQLSRPSVYQDEGDDFKELELFSIVAWDHVSWPGNDFYLGARVTDDGVKAAATDSMAVMTNVKGKYNPITNAYEPPKQYRTWNDVITQNKIELKIGDDLYIAK